MIAWIGALALAVIAISALWRFAVLPKGALELVLAAVVVGLAGYAWQGQPGIAGVSVQSREQAVPPDPQAVAIRRMMTNAYGDAAKVAEFADTLDRMGMTREAVIAVRTGIAKDPKNPELWVAMGNALVAHGGQTTSPAAEFAYKRAAALAPAHPAPPFFLGLAQAQSSKFEEAGTTWRALLARAPTDAPWRRDVEIRLAALEMAQQ